MVPWQKSVELGCAGKYTVTQDTLGHVKLIIWFSDTDFPKNDEGGYLLFVFTVKPVTFKGTVKYGHIRQVVV